MKKLLTSIMAFLLVALPTGLAHAEPNSVSPNTDSSRVQIIQLTDGKTRVKFDVPGRLVGKTVTIRSSRIIDGSRWTVVLGKAKVRPSGKVVFTTKRTVGVQDRVVVRNRNQNVLSEVIVAIGKPALESSPPSATPGGSSGSGASNLAAPRPSAESAAQKFLDAGGDPMSAAYLNLINHIENGGSTGQIDELLDNLDVVLRCGTGGTCPELAVPSP